MKRVLLTSRSIKSIYTSHLTKDLSSIYVWPFGPTNRFAMEGLNMAFVAELNRDRKPLPKLLFIDIMVKKTQKLIEHINHHHLGLSLTANIGEKSAVIRMYDNYMTVNSRLLHVTISNLPDLEDQLWRLYIEVNGVIHDFIPHLEDMPPLEDITDDEL